MGRTIKGGFEKTIIREIREKIFYKNENVLVVFVGKPRRGKSLCSITFLHKVDHSFTVRKRCAFELDTFFELLAKDSTTKCGVMIEEFGLKADKRAFMSKMNRYIRQYYQVWAYKSCCLVMTVPSMSYIDSGIEPLIDYVFDATYAWKENVDNKSKLIKSRFKVLRYQHNAVTGKTYRKHPRFWVNTKRVPLGNVVIHAPPENIIEEYLGLSIPYKDKITKEKGKAITEEREREINPEKFVKKRRDFTEMNDQIAKDIVKTQAAPLSIGFRTVLKLYKDRYNVSENRAKDIVRIVKNIVGGENTSPTVVVEQQGV